MRDARLAPPPARRARQPPGCSTPPGTPAWPAGRTLAEARSDVLLGLAADAVGAGRLGEARRLVARAPRAGWRAAVRRGWVSAEIELSAGRSRGGRRARRTGRRSWPPSRARCGTGSSPAWCSGRRSAASGRRGRRRRRSSGPALDDARRSGTVVAGLAGRVDHGRTGRPERGDSFCRWAAASLTERVASGRSGRSPARRALPVGAPARWPNWVTGWVRTSGRTGRKNYHQIVSRFAPKRPIGRSTSLGCRKESP